MEWTLSQQEAISHQGENILLSAAAGSGKTAVLVQRIIEKILNKENPVSVNELLVLTFTDVAAAEMKKKISAAINREFLADPNNLHLKRQRLLMGSANISTIHSFCMELLRANIHKTDIPVGFGIISEIENSMLKEKALDMVLSRFYENIDRIPSFKKLVLGYGSDKGDRSLREIIKGIMEFSQSMPYPAKWLNDSARDYKCESFISSPWHGRLFDYAQKLITRITELYDEILSIAEKSLPTDHPYHSFFTLEKEKLTNILHKIEARAYSETCSALSEFTFDRLPVKKSADSTEYLAQDNIKAFRSLAKKSTAKLCGFFTADEETVSKQLQETEPLARTLKNIVLMTLRTHKKMKRQKDCLDFNDLEHEALGLLSDSHGNPTKTALSLRDKYNEILIDEYQDTNYIQDKIFSLISREESNVFTVGDIKQSIYKFRNAVPELFVKRYEKYAKGSGGHLISLAKNFRSRENILDFTNFVFEKIMSRETGGIAYGKDERLTLGADYLAQDTDSYTTEVHIIDGREADDNTYTEAAWVAERIKKLIGSEKLMITDKKSGEIRPVTYSDIVILARNTRNLAPIYEEVFAEQGIPLYSEGGQSYLTSVEVQTVLSYLSIIDNPHQDIPLIAVLRSLIWRFTPDMLAKIRENCRKGDFYSAMQKSAQNGNVSCARFIGDLENLRSKAEYLNVSDIILMLYRKYNYIEIAEGMKGGTQRAENLRLLFERGAEFDATDNTGLLSFMLYIEAILSSDKDLTPAKIEGENSAAVKIMSIHKSKGLEFPVVMLVNAFGEFNTEDIKKTVLRHDKYGFGLKYADTENRIIYPSIPHKIISGITAEELMAEEMRLLYVALTRAKEKLIISAAVKQRTSAWASPYLAQDRPLAEGILNARSIGDWISYALARHKDAKELQNEQKLSYPVNALDTVPVKVTFSQPIKEQCNPEETEALHSLDVAFDKEALLKALSGKYVYEGVSVPLKMSVSEAKRRQSEEEQYYPHIFTIPTITAAEAEMISATDRGTITHFVLQHINMKNTDTLEETAREIDSMAEKGIISRAQMETVDTAAIYNFFKSDLGVRLKNAKQVHTEFGFYTTAKATDFFKDAKDEELLLQGTMDCFFREDNKNVVLLDYKTDKISENEIFKRGKKYLLQLKYYKQGLEAILGEKVNEAYICFLSCNKTVSLEELEKE